MINASSLVALPRLAFSFAFRANWRKAALATVLMLAVPVAMPFAALATKGLTDAITDGDAARVTGLAVLVALLWIAPTIIAHVLWGVFVELIDLSHMEFESRVIRMINGVASLAHLEQPEFADKLELLRSDAREMWYALSTVTFVIGVVLQFIVTFVLLVSVAPVFAFLLICTIPWIAAEAWSERRIERTKLRVSQQARVARHMLQLMTSGQSAAELRMFRVGDELRRRQARLWNEVDRETLRAEIAAGLARAAGQLAFGLATGAAIYLVTRSAIEGRRSLGDVVLILTLPVGISLQVGNVVGAVARLQIASNAARRLQWLERLVWRTRVKSGEQEVPQTITRGLRFEHVSFAYPRTGKAVLANLDVEIAAGSVVALVGENGAGKTTVAKLLSRFYDPTSGRITLDGEDIADFPLEGWRSCVAASYQEVQRYDLTAREAIGIGDLPRLDDTAAIHNAAARAGATEVIAQLPHGLATQLGSSYANGVSVSGGQWQKLALARGMMRRRPLLLLLDEPASALDALAEHELFDRYAAAMRAESRSSGAITIFTSHRFSTVRMADLIIVMNRGRIVEVGTHKELMERAGMYANLYCMQAAAYA